MSRALYRWAPVLGWMAVIFFFSAQPGLPALLPSPIGHMVSITAHIGEYLILGNLVLRAAVPSPHIPGLSTLIALWTVTVLYGTSDEYHQSYVPGRETSLLDLLADATGGVLGLYFSYLRRKKAPIP